jgi:hypothetical protein
MNVFTPDLTERKRILKNVCRNHTQWKVRAALAVVLFIIAIGLMAGDAWLLIENPTSPEGVMIFIAAGVCFACIPFAFALSVRNTAKYKCAFPYTSYANASLLLGREALEYVFWRVGREEPAAYSSKHAVYNEEDKFVYRIRKEDIKSIDISDDICRIKGNGIVQMPEWAIEDLTVKRTNKEFSFIMAFEQRNAARIIAEWHR